jgi:hypothetical protein
VSLQGCSDLVGRLQSVVDSPVPRGVVNHVASVPRSPWIPANGKRALRPSLRVQSNASANHITTSASACYADCRASFAGSVARRREGLGSPPTVMSDRSPTRSYPSAARAPDPD